MTLRASLQSDAEKKVLVPDPFVFDNGICLGAQSFEHANVLSEKINFSALGGPKVAIFGRDDLDPIYFDVIN